MSGVADIAPYAAGGAAAGAGADPLRPGPGGSTAVSTVAQLDGPFPNGRVQALRLPIKGRLGPGGSFAFGTACAVVSFNYLQMSTLQLGPTRLPVCPIGPAIVYKRAGRTGAGQRPPQQSGARRPARQLAAPSRRRERRRSPASNSSSTSLGAAARQAGIADRVRRGAAERQLRRLGRSRQLHAARRRRSATSRCCSAMPAAPGTTATSRADRRRRADRLRPRSRPALLSAAQQRRSPDASPATTSARPARLHHPASGTLVTDVSIEHQLSTGAGHALLDVPGLAFGPNFQPEELTRLTEGVVALVNGTVTRAGPDRLERAAARSPRPAISRPRTWTSPRRSGRSPGSATTMHFTDLLGLETAPHQVATVAVDQPRHPGRKRDDPLPAAAQQPRARSNAASGRSWAAG